MNKRITEKVYKRKFQRVFAEAFSGLLKIRVKPSRVKLILYFKNNEYAVMVGKTQGMEIKLKLYKRPQWEEQR